MTKPGFTFEPFIPLTLSNPNAPSKRKPKKEKDGGKEKERRKGHNERKSHNVSLSDSEKSLSLKTGHLYDRTCVLSK